MKDQRRAYLFGLTAVLLWSTMASAFKLSLRYLTPAELLLHAVLTSSVVLFVLLLIQGKLPLLKAVTWQHIRPSIGFGLLNPVLYYLVLLKAYDLLPAQQAQPINYTWAITLSLLSIPLLKQQISRRELTAVFISYLGVVVISTRGDLLGLHFDDPLGVALALISTVFWALYWIYNTRDDRDPVLGLLLNFLCGAPMIFVYILLTEGLRIPPLAGLLGATYVGLFEMGLTFVLWLQAMKLSVNSARIANLIFISPFLSLFFIYFLVGEKILPSTLLGLVLIICGLVVQQWQGRAKLP